MAFEGGIFLDILARLNAASIDRVLRDVKVMMKEAGTTSGDAFTTSFDEKVASGSRKAFDPLVEASDAAFREMQIGLAKLQAAEDEVNRKRVMGFKVATQQMIAAQRELDAAVANSQRLMADAAAKNAAVRDRLMATPVASRAPEDRAPASSSPGNNRGGGGPMGFFRTPTGRFVGAGSALAIVGVAGWGLDIAARTSGNLNDILTRHQDNPDNVRLINQGVYRIAGETGTKPEDLAKGAEAVEQAGYRGQSAVNVLETAAKVAQMANTDIDKAVSGITTTMNDFKVNDEQNNPAKFLDDMNNIAGKLVVTLGNLKDVNPAEYFKALANVEPIAGEYMRGVDATTASSQIDAIASVLSQTGMQPERGLLNTAQTISSLFGNPKGVKAKAIEQIGIRPEQISTTLQDQGLIPALDMINNAIQSKYDPATGLYNMGWKFNDAGQLHTLQQSALDQLNDLGPQGQAALGILQTEKFQAGTASGKDIKKAFEDAGITDPRVTGNVKLWLKDQQIANGPSSFVQGGQMPELNLGQVIGNLAGTGDVQRNLLAELQNLPQIHNMMDQYQSQGNAQGFQNSFQQWKDSLPAKMKLLEGNLEEFAGTIGEKILPAATKFAQGLNNLVDFFDRNKAAEDALIAATLALASAWGASKLINIGQDLMPAMSFAADKARAVGQLLSDRLPTQITKAGADIEAGAATLQTEEAAAGTGMGTKLTAAGTTAATTIEAGATTASTEMASSGIGAALKGAAATVASFFTPAVLAGLLAEQLFANTDWDQLRQSNDANGGPGMSRFGGNTAFGGAGQPLPFDRPDKKPTGPQSGLNPNNDSRDYGPHIPGHAHGGVVGYAGGGVPQPLMGMPDMGGDSILGMLPNGQPVGLRGGEGILTPDTVAMLGGEDGVNALNSQAKNPWSDPFKVGATFYGSFAKGMAKYSPWGKYLEASSQSIDALEKEHEQADKMQRKETNSITDFIMNYYDDKYAAMGDKYTGPSTKQLLEHPDKYWYQPGYGYRSTRSSIKGGSPEVMDAILNAAQSMGLDERQFNDVKWIFSHESGFDPTISNGGGHGAPSNNKAYGLGQFLGHMGDKYGAMGAYSGDPGQETRAAIQYMIDRYGSPSAAKAYWESHGSYAHGGVVGYAGGGIVGSGGIMSPGIGGGPDAGNWSIPFYTNPNVTHDIPRTTAQGPWLNGITMNPYIDDQGNWLTPWGAPWPKGWMGDPSIGPYSGDRGSGPNADPGINKPISPRDVMDQGDLWSDWDDVMQHPPGGMNQAGYRKGFASGGVIGLPMPQSPAPTPKPTPAPNPGQPQFNYHGAPPAPPAPEKGKKPPKPKEPLHNGPQKNMYGNIPNAYKIPGGTQPVGDRNIMENPSQQLTAEGKGFSMGGGLLGMAESAAATAANAFAPGSGQAAQPLFDLANRAMGFAGQLAGIGMTGLIETFLPNNSPGADPSKNIFGKMALGLAGAHPSGNNMAGSHAKQLDPKKDLDAGSAQAKQQPGIHIENIHNNTGDHSETFNAIGKAVNFANHAGTFAGQ